MLIIGYDDSYNGSDGAVLIQNSFGANLGKQRVGLDGLRDVSGVGPGKRVVRYASGLMTAVAEPFARQNNSVLAVTARPDEPRQLKGMAQAIGAFGARPVAMKGN